MQDLGFNLHARGVAATGHTRGRHLLVVFRQPPSRICDHRLHEIGRGLCGAFGVLQALGHEHAATCSATFCVVLGSLPI